MGKAVWGKIGFSIGEEDFIGKIFFFLCVRHQQDISLLLAQAPALPARGSVTSRRPLVGRGGEGR